MGRPNIYIYIKYMYKTLGYLKLYFRPGLRGNSTKLGRGGHRSGLDTEDDIYSRSRRSTAPNMFP